MTTTTTLIRRDALVPTDGTIGVSLQGPSQVRQRPRYCEEEEGFLLLPVGVGQSLQSKYPAYMPGSNEPAIGSARLSM